MNLRTVDGEFYHRKGHVCRIDDARYAGGYGSLAPGGGRGCKTA